jgi:glycosyltransferase involved in cell wall biosynthesis
MDAVMERSGTMPGLVSVVICAYNNWPDVEMTIESALHQSYQPLEVIVVDNSSTDATPEEVPRRFGRSARYIRQPNRECAGAYNSGFAVASGEFIQFVAGDDVLAPGKTQKQVAIFRANPDLDIVYGDIRKFQTLEGAADWTDTTTEPEDDMLARLLCPAPKWNHINTLGVLFHRRALERVGPWDENLYIEDTDYWLRAAWAGCRFGHCPGSPMGFRRIRPGQKTQSASAMARGQEALWEKALTYVTREPYRSRIAALLAYVRFRRAVSRDRMTTREALAKLALARTTSPETISALDCAAGYALIVLPGGTALAHSRQVSAVRRALARLLHYQVPQALDGKSRSSAVEGERGSQ